MKTLVVPGTVSKQNKTLQKTETAVDQMGYWSALASLVFALAYSSAQFASWTKLIYPPSEQVWLFLPSLFLAPSFLIAITALHYKVPRNEKIFTAIGIGFATVYCGFATLTYFTQLGAVYPLVKSGQVNDSYAFAFKPHSFTMAIDCLGYFFMSFSTLFTSLAFRKRQRNLYRWMLANGLLVALLIPAYFNPFLYYFASVWTPAFGLAMISAMKFFRTV